MPRMSGWVSDSSGTGLPGVTISVRQQGHDTVRLATSDGDGRFTFTGLTAGEYLVSASLSGFRRIDTSVSVGTGKDVSVALALELDEPKDIQVCCCLPTIDDQSRGRDLEQHYRLRVTDSAGRPLAGSMVVISDEEKPLELTSDREGYIEFRVKKANVRSLNVTREGFRGLATMLCCLSSREVLVLRTPQEVESGSR
jgi:carboxypeptidase family protein